MKPFLTLAMLAVKVLFVASSLIALLLCVVSAQTVQAAEDSKLGQRPVAAIFRSEVLEEYRIPD